MSGGQLQKLKLAQALYKDAPVLLLDEPTAALDPIAEHQIYQDYFQFSKDKLSIFISHRLSSTRFCDRIIYIKNGDITEVGTHEELMAEQKITLSFTKHKPITINMIRKKKRKKTSQS